MILRVIFVAGLFALATSPNPARAQFSEDVVVNAVQVPLNPEDPSQSRIGKLTYLGGLHLTSPMRRFGGLSGLIISERGDNFLAVSDQAAWWTGRLYFRDGKLAEVDDVATGPMTKPNGLPFIGIQTDAEALTLTADGVAYVAFERDHRLVQYNLLNTLDLRGALYAPTLNMPQLEPLRKAPSNGGIEALAALGRGLLLAVTEELRGDEDNTVRGWLIYNDLYLPLSYRPARHFSPTDMAVLPDGDLMVLERRYSPITGVAARLCIVPRASIKAETILECETVAELRPPLTVDNFEGLSARKNKEGETTIYIVSDDNLSSDQRTLLMMFRLEPEGSQEAP